MLKNFFHLKCILLFFLLPSSVFPQSVLINEASSSNNNLIFDEDGDDSDWIEFFNNSSAPFDLTGFYLSDSRKDLEKWQFPSTIIAPGEYLLVFASDKNKSIQIKHWETEIREGDTWKYFLPQSEPDSEWKNNGFDDSGWNSGQTGIGHSDNDDRTIIAKNISVFARKTFTVTDLTSVSKVIFYIDYDDGFVAYLNGVEFARSNMGETNSPVTFNQTASASHEALIYRGESPEAYEIDADILIEGENVLAVQVHDVSRNSTDMTLIPFLSFGLNEIPSNAKGAPEILNLKTDNLHTNFKLKAEGDDIYLTSGGIVIDSLILPELQSNISFGRVSGSEETFAYFITPTPGSENTGDYFLGVTPEVTFSQPGGLYSTSLNISLSTDNAEIYYTLDSSDPTTASQKYSSPINITSTTVVKAKSFIDGFLPAKIFVNSYIINSDHDLPVISLSTDPKNLWDYNEGIYVDGPGWTPSEPHYGANFWMDWEKPAHVELFEQDGEGFSENCGIKIFGAYSRSHAQKSLAVHFRGQYGTSELDYKLFPWLPYKNYKSFVLRNSGNDWMYTMLRDGLMQNIALGTDTDGLAFRPAVLYLNGEYWGIHNIREKTNEDYLSQHHGVDPDQVDILENEYEIVEGSNEDYLELTDFLNANSLESETNFNFVNSRIETENFATYQLLNIFFDNTDWPGNNIKYWKSWETGSRWRWLLYDTDFGFGLYQGGAYYDNTLSIALSPNGPSWPNPPWSTLLLRKLLTNNSFKNYFVNRAADLANSNFTNAHVSDLIDSLGALIESEISRHSEKWGNFSGGSWNLNMDNLRYFAQNRPTAFLSFFNDYFTLGGTSWLTLVNKNPERGAVQLNSLLISQKEWQGVYFNNNDIELRAVPKTGYKFSGWRGSINSDSEIITASPATAINVEAVFTPDGNGNEMVVINEINYNSNSLFDTEDWIEFYNNSDNEINLSGWKMKDSDPVNEYVFPEGTVLTDYLVLTANLEMFSPLFPQVTKVIGNFDFGFSGGGETIYLLNPLNEIIDSVSYDDKAPWPEEADGDGFTLELKDPNLDNNLPESWTKSVGHGSPGSVNGSSTANEFPDNSELTDRLFPNYPNPFNSQTRIFFTLSKRDNVQLNIYDVLGREIFSSMEIYEAGSHSQLIDFNQHAGRCASGVYLLVLNTSSMREVQKMVYLK